MKLPEQLPISAFVVSRNEGHLLGDCLSMLDFCNEIVVIDLESSDNTVAIAQQHGAKVHTVQLLPVVEMVHEKYIGLTQNDWVLITDPDEVASRALVQDIKKCFAFVQASADIATIDVPLVYFFKSHQLKGTSWGGVKERAYIIHKNRYTFNSNVHNGRIVREGFKKYHIEHTGKNHLNHYWMLGYRQIFEKHLRYLKNEGKSRYASGQRITFAEIVKMPFLYFVRSFVYARGFKDGFIGLFLSVFRAWYFTAAHYALYKYQKSQGK